MKQLIFLFPAYRLCCVLNRVFLRSNDNLSSLGVSLPPHFSIPLQLCRFISRLCLCRAKVTYSSFSMDAIFLRITPCALVSCYSNEPGHQRRLVRLGGVIQMMRCVC